MLHLMFLECLIRSQKRDGHIYQEYGRKRMQQKKPILTTLLTKFVEENYSNYFSKALNTSRLFPFEFTIDYCCINNERSVHHGGTPYKCIVNIVT